VSAALSWFIELVVTKTQASDVPWLVSKGEGTKPGGETGVHVPQTFFGENRPAGIPGISLFLFLVSEPRKSFLAPVVFAFTARCSARTRGRRSFSPSARSRSVLVNTRYLDGGRAAN